MIPLLLAVAVARAETAEAVLSRMRTSWESLRSYRTSQLIQERIDGELGPEQQIRVTFRKRWEIHLAWQSVHPGRTVYWNPDRHGGEVLVYAGGLAGRALGVLRFSIDNRILKRDTNYTPAAAGFGYLVETVWRYVSATPAERPRIGTPTERDAKGGAAWAITLDAVKHPRYARAEVLLAKSHGLPVQFTAWQADGAVAERYAWYDTEVNPALVDADFGHGYP